MNDSEEFDARVAKLHQPDRMVGDARVLARAEEGAGGVARAVLTAVDETILPAELTFASEAGETLTLSAAARRLRAVTAASDDLSPEEVAGRELEPEEEDGLHAALDLLVRFARGASGTVVVSERRGEENAMRGVSALRLIGMLPPDAGPVTAAVPPAPAGDGGGGARDFLAASEGRLRASMTRSPSGEVTSGGAEELAATLAQLLDGAGSDDEPALQLWAQQSGTPAGPAFGRALWADGTVLAMAFDAADVAPLVAAFQGSIND
ncbi:hypothetical protein [Jannaschia formosa]|uniref:hypothetical protein n=1 Tax=Jannaschia formosa TaxID=2259592 RepID=UPI001074CEE2|nr:hypothetical protein [Jannaschia formosa]TFL20206.1 hypothetical protein DR046_02355 [Jannaschia formosa]